MKLRAWGALGAAVLAGSATTGLPFAVASAQEAPAPGLAVFEGYAGSHSVFMAPRANSVFALPADQYLGATAAEVNSQPRAQGYAATYGVPLAQNMRGVGIPVDYHGQCYANYPGTPAADCGVPFAPGAVTPRPPADGPAAGGAFLARAEAGGDDSRPEATSAKGSTSGGALSIEGVLGVASSHSESRAFVADGVVHAVTTSVAQDVTVAEVIKIGEVRSVAEAAHPGDPAAATASARTVLSDITVAGVPVTAGSEGLLVNGQPLGEAGPAAQPVIDALAAQQVAVEMAPPPTLRRDDATGQIFAASKGLRVVGMSPQGDRFEMVIGQAAVRASATRAGSDTEEFVVPETDGQAVPATASVPASAAPSPAAPPAPPPAGTSAAPAASLRPAPSADLGDFPATVWDAPRAGALDNIFPGPASVPEPANPSETAAPAAASQPAPRAVTLASVHEDLAKVAPRLKAAYGLAAAVVAAGVAWALLTGRRSAAESSQA